MRAHKVAGFSAIAAFALIGNMTEASAHERVGDASGLSVAAPSIAVLVVGILFLFFTAIRLPRQPRWRPVFGTAAVLVLALDLLPPLDAYADDHLGAHMAQHLVLMIVVAPLLILASIDRSLLQLLPAWGRRRMTRVAHSRLVVFAASLIGPAAALGWSVGAMWAWHLPGLYAAATQFPALHAFEHGSLLLSSLLFWYWILDSRALRRVAYPVQALLLTAYGVAGGLLGAVLVFAPRVWTTRLVPIPGIDALAEQQLAGVLMWVPAGFLVVGGVLVILLRWMRDPSPGSARPCQVREFG